MCNANGGIGQAKQLNSSHSFGDESEKEGWMTALWPQMKEWMNGWMRVCVLGFRIWIAVWLPLEKSVKNPQMPMPFSSLCDFGTDINVMKHNILLEPELQLNKYTKSGNK
jgi:hypothetical protein